VVVDEVVVVEASVVVVGGLVVAVEASVVAVKASVVVVEAGGSLISVPLPVGSIANLRFGEPAKVMAATVVPNKSLMVRIPPLKLNVCELKSILRRSI
jgi:hypothetical protein